MKRLFIAFIAALFMAQPAFAQESDRARERENRDRIERLERQVRQMQREVYPEGRPANTAGFYDEPVATRQSVDILTGRIDTLERQIATLIRESQESQYRLGQMEAEVARLRGELAARPAPPPVEEEEPPLVPQPIVETDDAVTGGDDDTETAAANDDEEVIAPVAANDPDFELAGEEAYIQGYRLWNDGNNSEAITVLRAMETSFPGHRRVSWARNLIGRALLDSNQPRAAAEALLANYRNDPEGERAADSLYFLGQALMELDQPGQACRAYDELEEVYGDGMRDYLSERLPNARARANCS